VGSKLKAASNHVWEEEDEGEDQCLREQYQHYSLSRLSQGAVEKMFRGSSALSRPLLTCNIHSFVIVQF